METTDHLEDVCKMHRVYELSKVLSEIQHQEAPKDQEFKVQHSHTRWVVAARKPFM